MADPTATSSASAASAAEAAPASAVPVAGATDKATPKVKAKAKDADLPSRIHTWPYLVRLEFLCALIVMIVMTVWSITLDAPTEEPANPNRTPNPSKAPWYFLGLQEMLVYFDPWMAGVVLPSLIIVGLMVIPYVDINTKGNGYYTMKERPFALWTFIFGFMVLWIALIILGTFFRGPGWYLFMPWNYWDPHKTVALTNVDLPYQLGARKKETIFLVGMLCTFGFYPGLAILLHGVFRKKPVFKELGVVKFHIVAMLFLLMMSLPAKVLLRLAFNTKYIWTTKWFNI